MQVRELIERANSHTGSPLLTAQALGVSRARVYDWRNAVRPCPAEVQDRLLVLAECSDAEIAAHVIERAGVERKQRTTAASVAAFAGYIGIGAAGIAALLSKLAETTTMYIM